MNDYPSPSELVQFLQGAGYRIPSHSAGNFAEDMDRCVQLWQSWAFTIELSKERDEHRDLDSMKREMKVSLRDTRREFGVSTERTLLSYWIEAKLGSEAEFRTQYASGEFNYLQFQAMEKVAAHRRAAGGRAKATGALSNRAQKK